MRCSASLGTSPPCDFTAAPICDDSDEAYSLIVSFQFSCVVNARATRSAAGDGFALPPPAGGCTVAAPFSAGRAAAGEAPGLFPDPSPVCAADGEAASVSAAATMAARI